MNKSAKTWSRGLAMAGAACLLLGVFAYSPRATGASFGDGTVLLAIEPDGSEHVSYGNWGFPIMDWYLENSRDTWTSTLVPFHVPASWTAWVLYNYTQSGVDEVAFHYAVTMPL